MSARRRARIRAGGIDPGKKGWMTVWDGTSVVRADPIPWLDTEPDLDALLGIFLEWQSLGVELTFLEKQQSYPRESSKSSFTAGGGYLALKAGLTFCDLRFEEVRPAVWKKELGLSEAASKLPPLPKRPSMKGINQATKKRLLLDWKARKRRVESLRGRITRERKGRLKEKAVRCAQQLAPAHYDFRPSERAKIPSPDKAESFLLALLARRRLG